MLEIGASISTFEEVTFLQIYILEINFFCGIKY